MKKLLSGIVAMVVLMTLATNVKAASFVGSNKVNKGDTFTITVDAKDTDAVTIWLKYDPTVVEYVNVTSPIGDIYPTNDENNGIIKIAGATAAAKNADVTYTFKAKKTGNAVFSTQFFEVEGDTAPAEKTVEIVEKSNETGSEGTGTEGSASETEGTQSGSKAEKVNDQGKVIKTLPKTGVSYIAVAGLVLAVAGSVVLARKISK